MPLRSSTTYVPDVTLNTGARMPQLGFGVYRIPADEVIVPVRQALEAGYRSIDTATAYRNEAGVGRTARLLLRGDSAFYTGTVLSAARRHGARFSVTVSMNPAIRRAIEAIPDNARIPIRYPNAVWDDEAGAWIFDAEGAETVYTAFAGTKHEVTARLVVRRVRRQAPPGQDELLPAWRYHAFFTDTKLPTVEADLTHRAHAVVEQVFADLIDGPPAHLPSG